MPTHKISWIAFCAALLCACAAQPPADQVQRADTIRLCTSEGCIVQARGTSTFQAPATDPEAERRLASLLQLGEQNSQAAYDLGLRFLRGDGVKRDPYQAMEWMRKAADQGLLQAQLALGRLYLSGLEEMGADPQEAIAWLNLAAGQGSKEALQLLPQAQAAQNSASNTYQLREAKRTSGSHWYWSAPYYWYWKGSHWYLP